MGINLWKSLSRCAHQKHTPVNHSCTLFLDCLLSPSPVHTQFALHFLSALTLILLMWHLVAKVGTSNPNRTISLKRLQCVVENNNNVSANLHSKICYFYYFCWKNSHSWNSAGQDQESWTMDRGKQHFENASSVIVCCLYGQFLQ
jgi:hypothetical protein